MPKPFIGKSAALSASGLAAVAASLGVASSEIWTVIAVETSGCGFLADRRPQILYERHIFHRLTGGRFDDGDISDASSGGYGARGIHQYDRLEKAIALDRDAALRATSWGLGQVLGNNCIVSGFPNVETMVTAMTNGEDSHLSALAGFVQGNGLTAALRSHDWREFASGYNGPNFEQNDYAGKLTRNFQKYSTRPLPDLKIRTAQLYLTFAGFQPGTIDGVMGPKTLTALRQFQTQQGLPLTAALDNNVLERLAQVALV